MDVEETPGLVEQPLAEGTEPGVYDRTVTGERFCTNAHLPELTYESEKGILMMVYAGSVTIGFCMQSWLLLHGPVRRW